MDYCLILKVAAKRIADEIENGSNAVVSPMSIAIALNMLVSGSNGETLDQLLRFLGAQDTAQLTSNSQRIMSLLSPPQEVLDAASLSAQLELLGFISDHQPPPPTARDSAPPCQTCPSCGSGPPCRTCASCGSGKPCQTCPSCGSAKPCRTCASCGSTIMWTPPPTPSPYSVPMLCPPTPLPPWSHHNEPMMADEQYIRTIFVMANALWVDDDHDGSSPIVIKPSFAEISDSVFKALLIKNADSVNEGKKIKEEINSWAENETKGLIKNLLSPKDKLSPPLCITNGLYFKGAWQHPFKASNTRVGNFRLLNGRLARGVPFMTSQFEHYRFESNEDFKLLELPYWPDEAPAAGRFAMYIFLPHAKGGIRSLVARLNSAPATLHPLKFHLENEVLEHVWIPKLRLSHGFDAREAARARGLTLPFDRGCADFSNMAEGGGQGGVCVGSMIHKAFVEVDEEGTMGPAARDCYEAFMKRPYVSPNLIFGADHPFLFMIVTGGFQPLFVGAVLDPLLE